jgi:hypothetical protein
MNKKEFYKKLLGDKFTKEFITNLLQDIGSSCKDIDNEDIDFDEDGIQIEMEESFREVCGCCEGSRRATKYIFWEDLVEHFFKSLEEEK